MAKQPPINSDSVAQDQIRAFIERIERMEEEKKAIADDIKEIYAEAKGNGFDTVVLRQIVRLRKQDASERMEREAILELYMSALGMQAAPRDDDDYEPTGRRANLSSERAPSIHQPADVRAPNLTHGGPNGEEGEVDPALLAEPTTESLSVVGRGKSSGLAAATSPAGVEGDADRHPIPNSAPASLSSVDSGDEEANPVLVADTNHPGGENANSVGNADASHASPDAAVEKKPSRQAHITDPSETTESTDAATRSGRAPRVQSAVSGEEDGGGARLPGETPAAGRQGQRALSSRDDTTDRGVQGKRLQDLQRDDAGVSERASSRPVHEGIQSGRRDQDEAVAGSGGGGTGEVRLPLPELPREAARGADLAVDAGASPAPATNPVANVGEGANGAIAAASDDPASREADDADGQQLAASGVTDRAAVAPPNLSRDAADGPGQGATAANSEPNDGQPGEKPSTAEAPTVGAIGSVAVAPAAPSSVVAFTPKAHNGPVNSKGIAKPVGCQNLEVCASSNWRQRCSGCETAFNAKGVEIPHQGQVG